MKNFKKVIAAVLVMAVVATCAIGATVAWLQDSTQEVKNTFSPSTINIDLTEEKPANQTAEMVPGNEIEKDPKVTVKANSEACWLFVKIEESANFGTYMTYEVADGWTKLEEGVYYREVAETTADTDPMSILKDDKVTVKDEVTKAQMDALKETSDYPTLSFKAYAVQRDAGIEAIDTAEEAWALAQAQ